MQTLILPGFSVKNKDWLEECAQKVSIEGVVRPVTWDHWPDPDQKFDAVEKAWVISRHTKGEKINIIAKSIGTVVASIVVNSIPDQINKVIFVGIPLNDIPAAQKDQVVKAIKSLRRGQIMIIQNEKDPHGTFVEVKKVVPEGYKLISKDRADHDYPFYNEFNEFLSS